MSKRAKYVDFLIPKRVVSLVPKRLKRIERFLLKRGDPCVEILEIFRWSSYNLIITSKMKSYLFLIYLIILDIFITYITYFASCKISQLNSDLMRWVGVGIGQGLVGLASG